MPYIAEGQGAPPPSRWDEWYEAWKERNRLPIPPIVKPFKNYWEKQIEASLLQEERQAPKLPKVNLPLAPAKPYRSYWDRELDAATPFWRAELPAVTKEFGATPSWYDRMAQAYPHIKPEALEAIQRVPTEFTPETGRSSYWPAGNRITVNAGYGADWTLGALAHEGTHAYEWGYGMPWWYEKMPQARKFLPEGYRGSNIGWPIGRAKGLDLPWYLRAMANPEVRDIARAYGLPLGASPAEILAMPINYYGASAAWRTPPELQEKLGGMWNFTEPPPLSPIMKPYDPIGWQPDTPITELVRRTTGRR
jgi:hypothetical protein